jgi:NhaP-type Na+/H+ and K+/H+ antiporters with a unique C-terminal domain
MILTAENILLLTSLLLVLSIFASKTSFRIGVPALLMFLGVGMLAGSEGLGQIQFDDPKLAQFIGTIALSFILFSGGLDTKWESIKPVLRQGVILSTLGVFLTALVLGLFCHFVFDFAWIEAMLLASIVSSTDAAAVFSILRSRGLGLKRNLRPLLELESGSNDPMAYVLTISLISVFSNQDQETLELLLTFVKQMSIGSAMGIVMGKLMVFVINRINLDVDGLYPVLVIALVLLTFSFVDLLGGNGFLAIYLSGLILGNARFIHKKSLLQFYDGIAWLMQIVLFLTLGLLVYPSQVIPVMGVGLAISLFLIFVARPVSVFVSLMFFKMSVREKLFVSWVGLRGAVPIVFATFPLVAGVPEAGLIFHIVFFITLTSVLFQGTTLSIVAKWLHLSVPERIRKPSPLEMELLDNFKSELVEVVIPPGAPVVGKSIVQTRFPKSAVIVMISRNGKFIRPGGSTILEANDKLLVMADNKTSIQDVYTNLEIPEPEI